MDEVDEHDHEPLVRYYKLQCIFCKSELSPKREHWFFADHVVHVSFFCLAKPANGSSRISWRSNPIKISWAVQMPIGTHLVFHQSGKNTSHCCQPFYETKEQQKESFSNGLSFFLYSLLWISSEEMVVLPTRKI